MPLLWEILGSKQMTVTQRKRGFEIIQEYQFGGQLYTRTVVHLSRYAWIPCRKTRSEEGALNPSRIERQTAEIVKSEWTQVEFSRSLGV